MCNGLERCVRKQYWYRAADVGGVSRTTAPLRTSVCLCVHPKLLPYHTVLVIDSLVKWSVGLWKGVEEGNGKRELRWKTACHILQKWLIVRKEYRLQWMNIEMHKSEINKMLWLQCCFLSPGFLCCFFSLSLSFFFLNPTPIYFMVGIWLFSIIFVSFMDVPHWYYSSLSICSTSGLFL